MLVAVEHVLSTPIDIDTFSTDVKTAYAHLCDLYRIGKDLVTHSLWHIKLGKKADDQCRCPIKDQGNIDWQIERQSDCITYARKDIRMDVYFLRYKRAVWRIFTINRSTIQATSP